jgi:hypothetical protein
LAVINLDDPSETLKKVLRQSKYEVGTADWNPTSPKGELCAISVSFISNMYVYGAMTQ